MNHHSGGRTALTAVAVGLAGIGLWERPQLALGTALVLAALATVIATEATRRQQERPVAWRTLLSWVGGGAGAAFVLTGLVTLLGPAVVPVLLAALGLAGARCLWRDWRAELRPAPGPGEISALSNLELGRQWRDSGARLERARDDRDELAGVGEWRQRLLDEMERRDPAGFRLWLRSGARDPVPFLRGA